MAAIIIVLAIVALLAVAAAVWFFMQQRRSQALRERFGPEYDHVLQEKGKAGAAERELRAREERVEKFHIEPLPDAERSNFLEQWRRTQARFVDDPSAAIGEADVLIGEVMRRRGYPVADFEARAADLSVEHADVVSEYRAGHAIAEANARGNASTEDLRQAMVHYRTLFETLVGDGAAVADRTEPAAVARRA